jgi:glycosyltransferase involved in cell wall biosynthesis
MELTVIFPAYNEEAALEEAMERSLAALRKHVREFEVLIVDDGSKDATGRIADELAGKHPEIRVLHNGRNLGAGASYVRGLKHARGELVMHNGVDCPFDLEDLPKMLERIEEADIVVATRTGRTGYSAFRVLTSFVNVTLLNLLFGLHLSDYNFTQLYRKKVIDSVNVQSSSTAFVTPETIIRAHDMGFRIVTVPVQYHPRRTSVATSGSLRVIASSVRDMLRFWAQRRRPPSGRDKTGRG